LLASGRNHDFLASLLARSAFRRSVGDWDGGAPDLDELEEIAETGPMRLYLCDMRSSARGSLWAKMEAFAPLLGHRQMSAEAGVPGDKERKSC